MSAHAHQAAIADEGKMMEVVWRFDPPDKNFPVNYKLAWEALIESHKYRPWAGWQRREAESLVANRNG